MIAAFRHLAFAALCAGLVTGILTTAAHQIETVPLFLKAEIYEQAPTAPEALAHQFNVAVTVISLVFCFSLGATSGYFYRRFDPHAQTG